MDATDQDADSKPRTDVHVYRLLVARWRHCGGWQPDLVWEAVSGLDMPQRAILEDLTLHVLRLPGVAAVRIDHFVNSVLVQDVSN